MTTQTQVNPLVVFDAHAVGINRALIGARGNRLAEITEAHADFVAAIAAVAELVAAVRAEDATEQGSHEWQLAHDRKVVALTPFSEES